MAYYDSDDESDGPWDNYGSCDYDDVIDDYWYDDDYDEDEEDYDPWNNALGQQEECDLIVETIKMHKIVIKKNFPQKLKHFTVRGEGLFECEGCYNRWTSRNATIKVDLFKKRVFKKFTQQCNHCFNQITPFFTDDRFEEIMDKVADKFQDRMQQESHQSEVVAVGSKSHKQKCQCQKLGKLCMCWNCTSVTDAV